MKLTEKTQQELKQDILAFKNKKSYWLNQLLTCDKNIADDVRYFVEACAAAEVQAQLLLVSSMREVKMEISEED